MKPIQVVTSFFVGGIFASCWWGAAVYGTTPFFWLVAIFATIAVFLAGICIAVHYWNMGD